MTLRALLFTDVVDSTLLVERLGDARAAEVWAKHDRRARDLLARHHGREIDRSDGFFLLFEDIAAAAAYALAYHRALAGLGLVARAGLHVGPVTLRENALADVARGAKPLEVDGLAKPLTARIMALARGGQTLLSAAAVEALGEALPPGARVQSHGYYRLKGVDTALEICELGEPGAPFAPPPDFDKGYRVVRADGLWRPLRDVRHNLPAERDAFVGRGDELRRLAARLDAGARLLTVLGTAGTGKTRLVRRFGWTWLGDWPGGIYFCDLSEARSLDGIFFAVASALDVPLGRDDPAVQLGHAIAGRGRCLVLLDNFEQVAEHAQATLGRWLDRAPEAAFVVTSRERLHLPGEEILPLEPLPLDKAAIELFAVRARAQRPGFVVDEANRAAVGDVVRLLDGLPLAIELAAARVVVLSPAQLVARLRDRFRLLAGARGAAARQATLRAAIDWSWDLLTAWEQAALAQCSVFDGGFTLEAAEAVLDLAAWSEAPPTLDVVQALVDKCLLRTWVPAEQGRFDIEEPYFGMYVSIHEYAKDKLHCRGPGNQRHAEERHGRYFARFGSDEAIEALSTHGGVKRRRALAMELDNLVTACRRAVARRDAETAVATYCAAWQVLDLHGPFALGASLGAQVLAIGALPASPRAAALWTHASALRRSGRIEEAASEVSQTLALVRELHDRRREGLALGALGTLYWEQGRIEEARDCFGTALAIHRETKNRRAEGAIIANLGCLHDEQGRTEEAEAHYEIGLTIDREIGNRRDEGMTLNNLALLHYEQGRVDSALGLFDQALAIARECGYRIAEALVLGNLGILNRSQGRLEEARAHYHAAIAVYRDVGDRRLQGPVHGNLGNMDLVEGRLESARENYEAALAIHRASNNSREEGIILGSLANLLARQGRAEEALAHYERALAVHRAVGNRRFEGATLGNLGEHLSGQGRIEEAREACRRGEALLREVGHQLDLAKLLCTRGRADVAAFDIGAARAALDEAESIAQTIGAGDGSELCGEIVKLRDALRESRT
jgi:predicted ATPase/tetratricopeptide (TPR) repeat protein/class 3 adenylate cyclase